MASIGLIANPSRPACRYLVRRAAALIARSGRSVLADVPTAHLASLQVPTFPNAGQLSHHADLLMVFGGDGTMLRVAREVAGSRTAVVGINAGGLGFLTDVPANQMGTALKQIWAGKTRLESRPLIEVTGRLRGRPVSLVALNDFVVGRGATTRLIELEVRVNGEVLTCYRCDGLIVCSPTGSTAYSLAAGGAVVNPTAEVFTITPICPHTLSNRSVIVNLNATVQIQTLSERVETVLTADGQESAPLSPGDVVTIRRSRRSIHLLHLVGSSFFDTLRKKLHWTGSNVSPPQP